MPANILLQIANLTMRRSGKPFLDIPSISFKRGTTYALMGPNGSGKTTLLHILNRLIRPDTGEIKFDGHDLFGEGEKGMRIQRRMTLVMQTPFIFDTTIGGNVAYGLKSRGFSRSEITERVTRYLDLVGLKGYENRMARRLSGGEKQRVALARALAIEPELLLLDEPTTFIDRGHANFIERLILDIGEKRSLAIIFSTHNIRQAYRLADEVVNLHMGRICAADMANIYRGTVRRNGDFCRFHTGRIEINLDGESNKDSNLIAIDPREIAIATTPPEGAFHSSSQPNVFHGHVIRMEDLNGTVLLTVDIGERLALHISEEALAKLNLALYSEVWVTFARKAAQTFC